MSETKVITEVQNQGDLFVFNPESDTYV